MTINKNQKSKKISMLTTVHPPFDVRIFHKEAKTLAKAGYNITLIAQHPKDEEIEGIKIKGLDKLKNRFARMTKTLKHVYKRALEVSADVYHIHDPELILVGLKLKRKGKKVIYDVHEDVPRQILSKGWISAPLRKIVGWLVERIEFYAAKRFDYVVAATPHIRERFVKITPNTIDINNYPILKELCNSEITWSKKEKAVCYLGCITKARGILQMMEAINEVDCQLFLAGHFVSKELYEVCVKKEGWKKVSELGFLNRSDVKTVLAKSLAGLVLLHPEPNHINAQPNKMFEYMSAGIPVLASNFPLWREVIEKNNCGICVDPLNVNEIAEAIQWLIENFEKAEEMGENGRKAVEEKYNWENEGKKLIKVYEELLS